MDKIFEALNTELQKEHDIRGELKDIVKALEETNRKASGICQLVHSDYQKANEIIGRVKVLLKEQQGQYVKLGQKAKGEITYKFNNLWKNTLQKDVFVYTFITWLETGLLASLEDVQNNVLGTSGIPLELENYLVGVTFLTPELSRLCVNSVIAGDYERPKKIVEFVKDLFNGYQLLNLKNDFLRKRFDSMKYDLKKIEEVNLEVSLRGLLKKPQQQQ